MRVSLIKSEIVKDLILPKEITGSFWLTDFDENGNEKKILNIEATQDGWVANSNNDVFCILNASKASFALTSTSLQFSSEIAFAFRTFSIKSSGES